MLTVVMKAITSTALDLKNNNGEGIRIDVPIMEKELELMFKYPLITRQDDEDGNYISYRGYLEVNGLDRHLEFRRLKLDDSIFEITSHNLDEDTFKECGEVKESKVIRFLDKISTVVKNRTTRIVNFSTVYSKVLHEYSEFTKFFLKLKSSELSRDLQSIKVAVPDESNRVHEVDITIDFKEAVDIFKVSSCDLPGVNDLFKPQASLIKLFDQFLAMVEQFQPFFNFMDVLDSQATVLDPECPKRRDCFRRIWLEDNASLTVTVDPNCTVKQPDVLFLGPERLVSKYRKRLNDNLENWSIVNDPFEELLDLLGLECFPKKARRESQKENVLMDVSDCAICFSSRYNGKLPDVICQNKSCETFYHTQCLYEWLVSVNGKKIFNEIHGECPNCEKGISCSISVET